MKMQVLINFLSKGLIILSGISFMYVSLMAFKDPQSVMDLVQVKLNNNDAYSSIRGVYGGVGMAICVSLFYLMKVNVNMGLTFLALIWGSYVLSRTITIFAEGSLGSFGKQWLVVEALMFVSSLLLITFKKQTVRA